MTTLSDYSMTAFGPLNGGRIVACMPLLRDYVSRRLS